MARWSKKSSDSGSGDRKNVKGFANIVQKFYPMESGFLPTGVMYLDLLLGGGIPRGKMIEFASPSGLGKSTVMAFVARNICAKGEVVHWWDYENALS